MSAVGGAPLAQGAAFHHSGLYNNAAPPIENTRSPAIKNVLRLAIHRTTPDGVSAASGLASAVSWNLAVLWSIQRLSPAVRKQYSTMGFSRLPATRV